MAELATIARPYARAAFMHAQGAGAFKAWGDLLDAAAVAVADERIRAAIGAPQRNKGAAAELVVSVLGAAGVAVDSGAKNFLALLGENRRLETLPAIAAQFAELRAAAENVVDVMVVSAMALDAGQQAKLKTALGTRFKREVRLHESVDPTLLGGAVIQAGDLVIDGSLKGRLARLATQMTRD